MDPYCISKRKSGSRGAEVLQGRLLGAGLASTPPCPIPPPPGQKARGRDRPETTTSPGSPSPPVGKQPRAGSPPARTFNQACSRRAAGQGCSHRQRHWLCLALESRNLLSGCGRGKSAGKTSHHNCCFSYNKQDAYRISGQIPHACSSPMAEAGFFGT